MQPHRWQPTRLPHPWDSPGKNTGVGCHFLLPAFSWSPVDAFLPFLRRHVWDGAAENTGHRFHLYPQPSEGDQLGQHRNFLYCGSRDPGTNWRPALARAALLPQARNFTEIHLPSCKIKTITSPTLKNHCGSQHMSCAAYEVITHAWHIANSQ